MTKQITIEIDITPGAARHSFVFVTAPPTPYAVEPAYTAPIEDWKVYNRANVAWLRAFILQAGVDGAAAAEWSPRGYCKCGCSPAFIIKDGRSRDIGIKVTITEA